MGMKISIDLAKLKTELQATADKLNKATRPAAQAGADVVYQRAKQLAPVSSKSHKFYGTNQVYGPYSPGNLRDSIYQVFSRDNSYKDVSTYHVSWNADKAPYGAMVEFGNSNAPAKSFIRRAMTETRKTASAEMKKRFIEEVNK